MLNSLTREFVDASLACCPRGGRFLEMGKTDIRDAEQIAAEHPGVRYRAFDAQDAGPERIQEMLREILGLFERGALAHLPVTTWDVRRAGGGVPLHARGAPRRQDRAHDPAASRSRRARS